MDENKNNDARSKRANTFEKIIKPEPTQNDLFSRMPEEVFGDVERKLAEALPVFAVGHPHPKVREKAACAAIGLCLRSDHFQLIPWRHASSGDHSPMKVWFLCSGDKFAANYLTFVKLTSIRIWLRANESTP
jgi:hypothetical protein